MELSVSTQLTQAAVSFVTGAAIATLYDLFGIFRRSGYVVVFLVDSIFWFVCGSVLFALGMGTGLGELRIFMIGCAFIGAVLYRIGPGKIVRKILDEIYLLIAKSTAFCLRPIKKIPVFFKKNGIFFKNIFPKHTKWFTIINNIIKFLPKNGRSKGKQMEDHTNENKAGRYNY